MRAGGRHAVTTGHRVKGDIVIDEWDHELLRTARLVLREFDASDVGNLTELDSDPEVMHFLTAGRPTPRVEIEHVVLPHWLTYHERGSGFGFWAAQERVTGQFLGWFHLRPGEGHTDLEPELGYRLRRSAWGRGYATEGSRALVDMAFERLGVERVLAETMAVHVASRRVMEKAGMHLVREFRADWPVRIPGDEWGDVEYAIDRRDWLAGRSIADGDPGQARSAGSDR